MLLRNLWRGLGKTSLLSCRHFAGSLPRLAVPVPTIDSSINTMEQILSILDEAHQEHEIDRLSLLQHHKDDPEYLQRRLCTSLGTDVFHYKVLELLIQLQLNHDLDIFRDHPPESARYVLERYVTLFLNRYTRNPNNLPLAKIGELFLESPSRVLASLRDKLRNTTKHALGRLPRGTQHSPGLELRFPTLELFNPFRKDPQDLFALRKGFDLKTHPENILLVFPDHTTLIAFGKRTSMGWNGKAMQNLVTAYTMNGSQAFLMVAKRVTANRDPVELENTPFEAVRLCLPDQHAHMRRLKAIVAGHSRLLDRLMWYGPFRHSLESLDPLGLEENVVRLMADMCDRFFGSCYKSDPKYCEEWMGNVVDFCVREKHDPEYMSSLARRAAAEFRSLVLLQEFDKWSERWGRSRNSAQPTAPLGVMQDLLLETRQILYH